MSGGAGTVTSYTYDMLNNLSAVDSTAFTPGSTTANCTLPGSSTLNMRCFSYSTLSRLMSASNPESGAAAYTYDSNGNLTTRMDAIGNKTAVGPYDGLNRPQSTSYPTINAPTAVTPTVTYAYDVGFKGALSSVTNSVSKSAYTYDGFGRVTGNTQTTGANGPYTFAYGYSLTDALTSMAYPSGRQVNYVLDAADRVTTVKNITGNGNYATVNYKASGAVNTMTTGNGVTQTFSWNDRVQPTGVAVTGSGQTSLLTLGFFPCASVNNCASAVWTAILKGWGF